VPQDYAEAVRWFRKTHQRNSSAQANLDEIAKKLSPSQFASLGREARRLAVDVRRVTRRAHLRDVKIIKYSQKFDNVWCGPRDRDIETAECFGNPYITTGLDAWARGAYEGLPADAVKAQMNRLKMNPDEKPTGKSPISGKPGTSYNEFLERLLGIVLLLREYLKPNERVLAVTSGGDLQAIDHFAKAGFPKDLYWVNWPWNQHKSLETTALNMYLTELAAKPYWSAAGELFRLTDEGLEIAADNKEAGIYIQHIVPPE
jgi:broad specificity phosphatase PhoE